MLGEHLLRLLQVLGHRGGRPIDIARVDAGEDLRVHADAVLCGALARMRLQHARHDDLYQGLEHQSEEWVAAGLRKFDVEGHVSSGVRRPITGTGGHGLQDPGKLLALDWGRTLGSTPGCGDLDGGPGLIELSSSKGTALCEA